MQFMLDSLAYLKGLGNEATGSEVTHLLPEPLKLQSSWQE